MTAAESEPGASAPAEPEAGWVDVCFRARYAETDAQGVVYHSNYLVYMEVGRSELARAGGLPYAELEARGVNLLVVRAEVRYKAPARYDDPLRVRTRVREIGGRLVSFAYRIEHAESGRLLVTGETTHVCVNADFRPMLIPDWMAAALTGAAGKAGMLESDP